VHKEQYRFFLRHTPITFEVMSKGKLSGQRGPKRRR
jgi:hypothetical protein